MITRIIITDTSRRHLFPLLEFCGQNATLLEEHGVVYSEYFNGPFFSGQLPRPMGEANYGRAAEPSRIAYLRTLQSRHAVHPESQTLFIFTMCLLTAPRYLPDLARNCAHIFPKAELAFLFCPVPQENDLEDKILVRLSNTGYAENVHQLLKYGRDDLPDYEAFLRRGDDIFKEGKMRPLFPEPSYATLPQVLTELSVALGLDPQTAKEKAFSFQPCLSILLPREVAFFAAASNFLYSTGMPGMVYRWSSQAPHFSTEAGYAGSPHSLFGPDTHKEIREEFAESNASAAKMLGIERLFLEPQLETNWEPWTGLDADTAFKIAERLDEEFVQNLLADFEELPEYMRSRDQRIVHQALLEVSATAAKPAPLRRLQATLPKVAVLTLTHNHKDYIEQNIQSVIAQKTNFPIEHIIADDGSDDETQDIVAAYARKYSHIVPFFQEKDKLKVNNVQALFEMARSPYVALCDGDDYFTSPVKLQVQADFLDAHPQCALCFHPVRVLYEEDAARRRVYPPLEELPGGIQTFYDLSDLIKVNLMQTNSVMYRWRFRDGLPEWFRSDIVPGDWYWHILHAETGKIGFINKIMSVYRRHKKSMYYSAEINSRLHRNKTGMQELEVYSVINKHFNNKYASSMGALANGVFSDVLLYTNETGDSSTFDALVKKYPEFAAHFLASLKKVQARAATG